MDLSQKILSDIIVHMKYAKYIPEFKRRENWNEIVYRNMNMHIEKFKHIEGFEDQIRDAYQFVYDKKVLPSMRSMQFAGKPIDVNPARIYNCAFLPIDSWQAFSEIIFLLLGGSGVGYSVQFHHVEKLPEIRKPIKNKRYLVGDSIEGWSDAIRLLVKSYMVGGPKPIFDFRDIRPKGARLITSGGKAPGSEPLKECLFQVEKIFERKKDGDKLTTLEVHTIICHLADAVLSGGIRRCLSKDYLVMMEDGSWKKISDCKVGDKILFNGSSYSILNVFDQGRQTLYKINTVEGYQTSTENHRWLVYNIETNEPEWVETKNMDIKKHKLLIKK